MTVPYVPHAFATGDNLDLEKVNDDLEAISRSVRRNLDARYTYSHMRLDLDNVADTDVAALRQLALLRPNTSNAVEVYAVELVIYGNGAGDVWTLSCSDTTWPSISLTTVGSGTTEVTASSSIPVSVTSASTELVFTLACSTASTITRGYLVVHLRCDRGNQGSSHAGYDPTLLTSASTGIGTLLDTELTNLESAVSRDTANATDLRAELYAVRNLAAAGSVTWRAPSGARVINRVTLFHVAAATETITVDISGGITAISVSDTGDGVATRGSKNGSPGADATQADDPMDATDDLVVTISDAGAASALLAYAVIWWQ